MYFNLSNILSLSINVIFMITLPSFSNSYHSNFMPCSLSIHCCLAFLFLQRAQVILCLASLHLLFAQPEWPPSHLCAVSFFLLLMSLFRYPLEKIMIILAESPSPSVPLQCITSFGHLQSMPDYLLTHYLIYLLFVIYSEKSMKTASFPCLLAGQLCCRQCLACNSSKCMNCFKFVTFSQRIPA